MTSNNPRINSLVLDAGPLITQNPSSIYPLASHFYVPPTVYNEIRDEHARKNLTLLWDNTTEDKKLILRQPKQEYIQKIRTFAMETGDYSVLSNNDIYVLALCYELECELNNGDWRLRRHPNQKRINGINPNKPVTDDNNGINKDDKIIPEADLTQEIGKSTVVVKGPIESISIKENTEETIDQSEKEKESVVEDGWETIPKKSGRGRKQYKSKQSQQTEKVEKVTEYVAPSQESTKDDSGLAKQPIAAANDQAYELVENEEDDDDDEGWITPENIKSEIDKSQGEVEKENKATFIKAGMCSGDFAMQNVAIQIGLNLINTNNGLQIKKVKSYMLRCHACFKLVPMPKNGVPLHFCPKCGGATLLRCSVSVSSSTGKIQVFLKRNMQWSHRGNKYSLSSPQSRASRSTPHGFQHGKTNKDVPLLRADQKEYEEAVKQDQWQRRKNEKYLDEWIGNGADMGYAAFATQGTKATGIKIGSGKGRYVNGVRKGRK